MGCEQSIARHGIEVAVVVGEGDVKQFLKTDANDDDFDSDFGRTRGRRSI
jgi:hypothetical protein